MNLREQSSWNPNWYKTCKHNTSCTVVYQYNTFQHCVCGLQETNQPVPATTI